LHKSIPPYLLLFADCVLALLDVVLAGGLFTAAVFDVFAAAGGAAPGP
jgi:hypothetical protein